MCKCEIYKKIIKDMLAYSEETEKLLTMQMAADKLKVSIDETQNRIAALKEQLEEAFEKHLKEEGGGDNNGSTA